MENQDDYRRYMMYAVRMMACIVLWLWMVAAMSGCATKKSVEVREEVIDLDLEGIRRLSSETEAWRCVMTIDSVAKSGTWKVVRYDTERAVYDEEKGSWNAPVVETIEGKNEGVRVTNVEEQDRCEVRTKEDERVRGEIHEEERKEREERLSVGGRRDCTILGVILGVILSFLVVEWCRKNG